MEKRPLHMSFVMRVIHNQVKDIISKSVPKSDLSPQTQLQGGIMGYLFHHKEAPVYQKDIEKEFSKLTNRLHKTPMYYDAATLEKIAGMIHDKLSCPEKMAGRDQELLDCLGNIIEVR